MEEIFVGRQPILDSKGNLFSFELLYRDSHINAFPNVAPEVATIGVIVNTYLAPGFEEIAAEKTFINFSASLLASDIFNTLNPNQIVIEVLEDVEVTYALFAQLEMLKGMGFEIALDDFILQKQYSACPTLFQYVDYIKVDFLSTTESERYAIENLKVVHPHLILLAEKVETEDQFETAKSLGYELFQGYFFAKPDIVKSTKLPSNTLLYFEIIKLLNEEVPNIEEITAVIMRDVSLTYKLLKYLNTYAFKSSTKVISVQQAIVRMGLQEFKKWIQFLTIYQENTKGMNGRNRALVNFSLTRANLCELLAKETGKPETDEYYMLGMFSLIDVILKRAPSDIFPLLPVNEEIIQTLSGRQTEMTPYLKIAEALERLDFLTAIQQADRLGINERMLSELALRASVIW